MNSNAMAAAVTSHVLAALQTDSSGYFSEVTALDYDPPTRLHRGTPMANGKELVFTIDLSEFRKIGLLADGLETEVADAIYMAIREGLPTVRQQISDAAPRSKYAQYVDRQPGHRIANQVRLGAVVRTGNDVEGTIRTGKATIFTLPPGTKAHYIHVKDDTR